MMEIKKRFNISKLSIKNLFLVVLLMIVMVIAVVISKLTRVQIGGVNIAQAQTCWTITSNCVPFEDCSCGSDCSNCSNCSDCSDCSGYDCSHCDDCGGCSDCYDCVSPIF